MNRDQRLFQALEEMREEINSVKVLLTNALTNNNFLSMSEVPTLPEEVSLPLQNADDLKKVEKKLAFDEKVEKLWYVL